jgi:hypothetical protein
MMKQRFFWKTAVALFSLFILIVIPGCGGGGGGGGGGLSGGGGSGDGGGINPGPTPGAIAFSTSVPQGTPGAVPSLGTGTYVLPYFQVAIPTPTGGVFTGATDSFGNFTLASAPPGNYLIMVSSSAYPSTALAGLVQVIPGRSPRVTIELNATTTAAALIALRYVQSDSGRVAGMEISVLNRITAAGTNPKFADVVTRLLQYLPNNTVFLTVANDIPSSSISDTVLLNEVDAAKNSITMVVDSSPYFYETGVTNPVTTRCLFNHDLTNTPPDNSSYIVTRYNANTGQTVTINGSNYTVYGHWNTGNARLISFTLERALGDQAGKEEDITWSYSSMPIPTDGTPLETDTAGQTNTQVFWMQ